MLDDFIDTMDDLGRRSPFCGCGRSGGRGKTEATERIIPLANPDPSLGSFTYFSADDILTGLRECMNSTHVCRAALHHRIAAKILRTELDKTIVQRSNIPLDCTLSNYKRWVSLSETAIGEDIKW
jgi:hypothetical protein